MKQGWLGNDHLLDDNNVLREERQAYVDEGV